MTEATAGDAVDARLREGAFLLLDKPRGPSSHQVTAWARDLIGVSIAGHAGTLTRTSPGSSGSGSTATGHFGRDEAGFTWERTDQAAALRAGAGLS